MYYCLFHFFPIAILVCGLWKEIILSLFSSSLWGGIKVWSLFYCCVWVKNASCRCRFVSGRVWCWGFLSWGGTSAEGFCCCCWCCCCCCCCMIATINHSERSLGIWLMEDSVRFSKFVGFCDPFWWWRAIRPCFVLFFAFTLTCWGWRVF